MFVDGRHGLRKLSANVTFKATSEYRVHQKFGIKVKLAAPGHDDAAVSDEICVSRRRIALKRLRIDQRQDRHKNAFLRRKSRDDVTVTGVVAGAANRLPALRIGKSPARRL